MAERRSNMQKAQAEVTKGFNVWKNDLILKPGFRPVRLCWAGYTMVRFLPGLNPGDDYTTPDSFRFGEGYGTWIETVPVVMNMLPEAENGSISFVLPDRIDYEPNFNCPYKALWFALKKAIKNKAAKSEWKDLVIAGKFGTPLPPWRNFYFAYCCPYHADFKEKDRDKNNPARDVDPSEWSGSDILIMSSSAYNALDGMLENRKDIDLTDPAHGAFVGFWPEKTPYNFSNPVVTSAPSEGQFKGYATAVYNKYPVAGSRWQGADPALPERLMNFHMTHAKPWEKVFNFMTYEEQAEKLGEYMVGYEDLLLYAWDGHDEWITKKLRDKARGLNYVHPTAVAPPVQTMQYNPATYPTYISRDPNPVVPGSPVNYVTPTKAPQQQNPSDYWTAPSTEVFEKPAAQAASVPFEIPGAAAYGRDMSNFDNEITENDIFG